MNFETGESVFIVMMVERLEGLEKMQDDLKTENVSLKKEVQALRIELDRRCPQIFLKPDSLFTSFNDGYNFIFSILQAPVLRNSIGDRAYLPFDERHWAAQVLPDAFWVQVGGSRPLSERRIRIGRSDEPVDVKTFIKDLHEGLLRPDDQGKTLADDIEISRAPEANVGGSPYYGTFYGLQRVLGPRYMNDMALLINRN